MAPLPRSDTGPFLPLIPVLLQGLPGALTLHSLVLYKDVPPP